ncbi:oligosaccharide flippase family protein [Geodermatophilus sp. SYSU D00698]
MREQGVQEESATLSIPARRDVQPSVWQSTFRRFVAHGTLPLCSFIAGPILARTLGVEGRGLVAAITVPLTLGLMIVLTAMGELLTADVASERSSKRDAFWGGTVISVSIGIVLATIIHVLAPTLVPDHPDAVRLLQILAWCLVPAGVQVSLRALRQGERRYKMLNREPLFGSIGRLGCLLLLWAFGWLNVTTAAVTTAFFMIGTGLLLGRPPPLEVTRAWRGIRDAIRGQLSRCSVLLIGSLAYILTMRADQLLLTPLAGPRQLGLYAVAVTLAEIPLLAADSVRMILLAEVSARRDPHLVARACRLGIACMIPIALVGAALSPIGIYLLYGASFSGAALPTVVLLASTAVFVPGSLMSASLIAFGHPGLSTLPTLLGLMVTAVVAPVAVIWWGATGAALATFVAYLASSILALLLFRRHEGISLANSVVVKSSDLTLALRRVREAVRAGKG